ncbi:hypothetical protein EJD97_004561 [Solanum chilense]|uniref:DUF3511 domain-containing protein n=1 Tax=Solanum chilense TaxID=4083 RepID=A0A6N2BU89_SOLCI|nr:hypothetical protein EJD97_004561 [Solanum chilense]
MDDYRSKCYGDGIVQYHEPQFSNGYSATSVGAPPLPPPPAHHNKDLKLKKGKSTSGSSWNFNDPEFQRKRRVASYKVYSVEGKVKGSLRRSLRWFKDKYTQVLYGWR